MKYLEEPGQKVLKSDGLKMVSHIFDSKTQGCLILENERFCFNLNNSTENSPPFWLGATILISADLCLAGISLQVVCRRQVDHSKCHMNHSPSFDRNIFRHTIKKCQIWKPFI